MHLVIFHQTYQPVDWPDDCHAEGFFSVAVYANPSLKGILHIGDMIQGTVFVCTHLHRNISLICVSPLIIPYKQENSSTVQKLQKLRRDKKNRKLTFRARHQATKRFTNIKEMCVKNINKLDKKALNHWDRRTHRQWRLWWSTGVNEVCELLIVLWCQLQALVCTD